MGPRAPGLVRSLTAGDRRALARAITLAESGLAGDLLAALPAMDTHGYVVGVTGPPGAGKSTLVDRLARAHREQGLAVAVIAVDPSSPFTGGAILGDRVRMQDLALDPMVFIRSMATRGALGGLAAATADAVRLAEAAGFAAVLVETVGAGQAEVEVARLADTTVVIDVPGLGDSIQTIKAGILEIGDVFCVNKADRPGADLVKSQIEAMLDLAPASRAWRPPVVTTVASSGEGIEAMMRALSSHRAHLGATGELAERRAKRREEQLTRLVRAGAGRLLFQALASSGALAAVRDAVARGDLTPHEGARRLLGPWEARLAVAPA